MIELLRTSRSNVGAFAECLESWTGADSVESRVACVRAAELMNLVYAALTKK